MALRVLWKNLRLEDAAINIAFKNSWEGAEQLLYKIVMGR
jgi:hypothetical protein